MSDEKKPAPPDPRTCPHTHYRLECRGSTFVQVPVLGLVSRGVARLRIVCAVCRTSFPLLVPRRGVASDDATVSEDGLELRVPFVKPDLRILLDEEPGEEDPPTLH
jgi:hypothetical protein